MITTGNSYTPEIKEKAIAAILKSLENGAPIVKACTAAGISTVTFWTWRKDDPKLAELVEAIEAAKVEEVKDALFDSCVIDRAPKSIEFYLTNKDSAHFKKRLYNTIENPDGTGLLAGIKALPDNELDRRITEVVTRLGMKSG